MQKISSLDPAAQTGYINEIFKSLQGKLGLVPNLAKTMGHSPAALTGYLSFRESLMGSSLGIKLGEQIAITVANTNHCSVSDAIHSYIGENMAGLDETDVKMARIGKATDLKAQAALAFCKILVEKKGNLLDADFNYIKNAGYTDAQIIELIAHAGLNIFVNYFSLAVSLNQDSLPVNF